jgi:hypothetical protein
MPRSLPGTTAAAAPLILPPSPQASHVYGMLSTLGLAPRVVAPANGSVSPFPSSPQLNLPEGYEHPEDDSDLDEVSALLPPRTLVAGYRGHHSAIMLHDKARLYILNVGASPAPTAAASPAVPAPPSFSHVPDATLKARARPARTPVFLTSTNWTTTASARTRASRATGLRGACRRR